MARSVIALFVIFFMLFPAIYVYLDAKNRQTNALAWALLTFFLPGLIGFVIYLVARPTQILYHCAVCETVVEKDAVSCPHCKAKLQPTCPECKKAVDPNWNNCPYCSRILPRYFENIVPPLAKARDTGGKLLEGIMLFLFFLFVLMLIA